MQELEGDEGQQHLDEYADAATERGRCLLQHASARSWASTRWATSRLDGLLEAIGIDRDKVCTYCWSGRD